MSMVSLQINEIIHNFELSNYKEKIASQKMLATHATMHFKKIGPKSGT